MEEQKQAEQQWNKIRRERINILKEAPSEENLWQAVMAFQDYPFKTVTGLPFQYTLKTGKNGEWTKELWIDRREKSKSLEDIWGLVINEALANGLPVITTKRCGAGLQMLSEKEVGCLVDVDDTQALTKAILDIKHDPVLKEHMSQNAIAISRQYTIEKMVERHISVLNC